MNATLTINEKEYQINPPTIRQWMRFQMIEGLEDENLLAAKLISIISGISEKKILEHNFDDVLEVGGKLMNFILNTSHKFVKEFEFEGEEYEFVKLDSITFGHWIDIDSALSKAPIQRKKELNLQLALLYLPKSDNGKYLSDKVMQRAEKFNNLSIEYLFGALFFLRNLERVLKRSSPDYLYKAILVKYPKIGQMIVRILIATGAGLLRWKVWRMKTLLKFQSYLIMR
jgi:hypothetical protein